jgi:hypothetical protein
MIKWIAENKEWLFSGVGITVFFGILYLIRRATRRSQPPVEPALTPASRPPAPFSSPPEPKKLVELDIPKIIKEIESLPPFQRDDARKHYVGVRFRFTGTLFSAKAQDEGTIRICLESLSETHLPLVFGRVPVQDNPQLKIVHEGARVTIEGDLAELDSHSAGLENIKILSYEDKKKEEPPNR